MSIAGMKLIFAGSGAFGVPTLARLLERGAEVVHVYSQPDKPAGRGKKLTPTPITEFALARGLNVTRTDNIGTEALPAADLLVVIAFGQKIPESVIHHCRLGSINLHASLLPKYRGAAPINWAVVNGETVTGNSVIRLAQKMDAGAVLGQSRRDIPSDANAGEIHDALALDGAPLMEEVITQLREGRATEIEQDHTQATLAPKITREKTMIDWTRPAGEIHNLIRGFYPWPGVRVTLMSEDGKPVDRITIVKTEPTDATGPIPGTILPGGAVACGTGSLKIAALQPEGKRSMPLEAYQNGHPWNPGMKLQSLT